MPTKTAKRHLVGVSETGELMDDPAGFYVEEDLMSDKYGMASPESPATPYLVRPAWDRPFKRTGWRYVMLSVGIGDDSNWLTRQCPALYSAARMSLRSKGGPGWLDDKRLGALALVSSIAALIIALLVVGGSGGAPQPQPTPVPAPTAAAQEIAPGGTR